eukprot:scaffold177609_cov19-Prasinocladus_malaysianus.AAC.1
MKAGLGKGRLAKQQLRWHLRSFVGRRGTVAPMTRAYERQKLKVGKAGWLSLGCACLQVEKSV